MQSFLCERYVCISMRKYRRLKIIRFTRKGIQVLHKYFCKLLVAINPAVLANLDDTFYAHATMTDVIHDYCYSLNDL